MTICMYVLLYIGRCGFTRRLKGYADKVNFNNNGTSYLLIQSNQLHVYNTSNNECIIDIHTTTRINQAKFLDTTTTNTATTNTTNTHTTSTTSTNTSTIAYSNGTTTATTDTVSEASDVLVITDNRMLCIYNNTGILIYTLDCNIWGGRPKDFQLFNCTSLILPPTSTSTSHDTSSVVNILKEVGELVSVITSTGYIAILSIEAIRQGLGLDECILVSTSIAVEPRLIALAVTTRCMPPARKDKPVKGKVYTAMYVYMCMYRWVCTCLYLSSNAICYNRCLILY